MAKDRNTVAKRQREAAKKQKADDKRKRRAAKKPKVETFGESQVTESRMSSAELAVLAVFSKYLMMPGEMLCCRSPDPRASDTTLEQLTRKGLLIQERFRGGYALTEAGFAAMRTASILRRDSSLLCPPHFC